MKVFAVTGHDGAAIEAELLALGFDAVLTKPVRAAILDRLIHRCDKTIRAG